MVSSKHVLTYSICPKYKAVILFETHIAQHNEGTGTKGEGLDFI